ncbi:MAG: M1 family metallopeptidase [Gemmatirosa sp.]|nr:M1 family metallopeptidase [Gemmatirosa sp.]
MLALLSLVAALQPPPASCPAPIAPPAARPPAPGPVARSSPLPLPDLDQRFAGSPRAPSRTTPPNGDTTGYWQQRADYTIVATLDEAMGGIHGTARLIYVNASRDTLRELFVHQHLNAFRPSSKWSATDEWEGRSRYQRMGDPDYAYERFTSAPRVNGVAVAVEYPGSPDSTVVRLALPRPLVPHDSIAVDFAWDARLSTLPRRQGRLDRHLDFAQWYPKVAVYDRSGWQPHALVPAGEFYGEYGTYDVTLVLPNDQVVGATGVPVEGDPGWARVAQHGAVPRLNAGAYGPLPAAPNATLPAGFRRVRFVARGVHHFGWSTSPDYRYEGGMYVRAPRAGAPGGRFATWDTVALHALYGPGDDSTWGDGRATSRLAAAVGWLERVYGPYGYPQMTVLHRLDGGGTEFPMVQMNGSAEQGLLLHEGGHIFSYGLLGNNEWQSGWMDEGLTSYQTSWATGMTVRDLATRTPAVGGARTDAAWCAALRNADSIAARQSRGVRRGEAQPIGIRGDEFANFAIYNGSVYGRAEFMYSALRDAIGDDAFARFLRDYYARWAFRHVDEAAMRGSAERVTGKDLGWFFTQWVHDVGEVDYALRDVRWSRTGTGWTTRATLTRLGRYRHPMPVGVRTASGWTLVRGDAARDGQTVTVRTPAEPLEVRLDPFGTTGSWTARQYVVPGDSASGSAYLRTAQP